MRKLVTVQTITAVDPIPDADRIEVATVGGWRIVVGRDEFMVGDKAAYFELDSFLPASNPIYDSFQARGQKTVMRDGEEVTGHVLRTAKLRGVISQGMLMGLEKLGFTSDEASALTVGTEITEQAGVFKYEPPLPVGTNIIGTFDARFAPKTDAERGQNLTDVWDLILQVEWEPTLKVDGTSQTIVNDDGVVRIFGRNTELDPTSAAGLKVATAAGLVDALEPGMAIQFELVGEGIQGNRLRLTGLRAMVFAVWRNRVKQGREVWPEAALTSAVPVLGDEFKPRGTMQDMIDLVDGIRGHVTKNVLDEGVVWHPVDPSTVPQALADKLDTNANWKIISNKWLLKGGE